jgi:hypothetical protein
MYKAAIAIAATVLSVNSHATQIFTANLTNSQENPPVNPTTSAGLPRTSSGTATFILNDDMTALSFTATIMGIDVTGSQSPDTNDNLTAAHIHAGPLVNAGVNGPAVWGFFGTPFNDNNPNNFVLTPFSTGVGGTFSGVWNAGEGNNTSLAAQLTNIMEGRSYVNFHSSQFLGGELRGALIAVPEPRTYALMLYGGLMLLATTVRQRRRG